MWFWGWIKGDGPCSWHHLHPLFADGASSLGRYLGNNYRGQFTAGQEVQIICCQIRRFGKTQMTWGNFGRGRAGGRQGEIKKKKLWRNKLNHLSRCLSSRQAEINSNCDGAVAVIPVFVFARDMDLIVYLRRSVSPSIKQPRELRLIFHLRLQLQWDTRAHTTGRRLYVT